MKIKLKFAVLLALLTWSFSAYGQTPVLDKGSIPTHLLKTVEKDGTPAHLGQMLAVVDFGDGDSLVSYIPLYFLNDSTLVIGTDTIITNSNLSSYTASADSSIFATLYRLDTAKVNLRAEIAAISPDPTMGGDLSGTASNAQIVAGAVGNAELATDAVTADKIIAAGVGSSEIANGSVTNADLANMAANTIKGRNNVGTGDPKDLTATEAATVIFSGLLTIDGAGSGLDADLLDGQEGSYYSNLDNATGTIATAQIEDDAVTLGKIATGTANRLQVFDASGNPAEGTVTGNATLSSGVLNVPEDIFFPGMPFEPPFAISMVTSDSFTIDQNFSLKHYAGVSPADTLYVNVAVGSSGDGQTWGNAYKGVDEAITAANSAGTPTQIRIAGGWYFDQHSSNAVTPTVPVEMIGDTTQGGRDTVFLTTDLRDQVGSFSATSNYYTATLTTQPGQVYDRRFVDAYGDSLSTLTLQASAAAVDANPGSWWWNSNTIYIRTADSRAPDSDIVFAKDAYNFSLAKDSIKVYMKDLYFVGGGVQFGLGTGGKKGAGGLYIENCTTEGTGYGITGGKTDEVFIFNSRFSKTDTEDILSYGDSSNIIEYNLHVYNASEQNTACTTCNASTSHGSDIIRIDGNYHHTYGPVIADVVGANSWNMGVIADSSLTVSSAARSFYFGADVDSLRASYVLQGCKSRLRASTSESIVADGNNVYIYNFTGAAPYNEANGGLVKPLNKTYLPRKNNNSTASANGLTQNYLTKWDGTKFIDSEIYQESGKVGIFTSSPTSPLHVKRNASSPIGAPDILIDETGQEAILALKSDANRFGTIRFSDGTDRGSIRYGLSTNTTFPKQFRIYPNTTVGPFLTIDSLTRLGINTVPETFLHVKKTDVSGTFSSDYVFGMEHNSDDVIMAMRTNSIRSARIYMGDQTNVFYNGFIAYMSGHGQAGNIDVYNAGDKDFRFYDGGVFDADTGYRIGNTATSGHFLYGNGTNFVSTSLASVAVVPGGNTGALEIGTNNATALNLETNNVTYATLSSGGGFSLTNSRLSVNGSGAMDATAAAQITLSNTSASQFAKMQVDDSGDFNISTVSSETQLKVKNTGGTEVTGYFMCTPMTATAASAITPSNGMMIYVSDTNGTFTSVGFWGYENGAWTKLL